ncbi:variable surface lipoprotein [Mycoplasma bovis]|nr:variable surface lipoprotein [Mycoplasmopsis bovis]
MWKKYKIFITLASIVSISSLPIVAASCDVEKTEEGTGANSGTKDQEDQTPPKDQKDKNTKKYRLPELKEFLDKNDGKLFEVDREKAKEELEDLASEGALRIVNGKIKHHKDKGRGKSKKSRSRNSYKDVEHLMLDSKFGESNKVNTNGKNKENIGYNLGGNKKGIKISKEDNKIVLEWQLYFEDGTKDDKIYRQEINLN